MRLWSDTFRDGSAIPAQCALAAIDPVSRVRLSGNRHPHLAWDEVPAGTESLVLFCIDGDAPQDGSDVNLEGRTVPASLARGDFFHWTLADLPPTVCVLPEGALAAGVVAHGKPGPAVTLAANGAVHALRQGINDYTGWFAGDPAMAGDYYGYDGPCPPWNDLRLHHYIFRIYALDVPRLALEGRFTGPEACAAIHGHIIDEAQLIGTYTLNPALVSASNSAQRAPKK
ncbi:MAG: YbhB/YbcL family Raf kinase inhibitor-like protein [Pseudomonadota bacterium]